MDIVCIIFLVRQLYFNVFSYVCVTAWLRRLHCYVCVCGCVRHRLLMV